MDVELGIGELSANSDFADGVQTTASDLVDRPAFPQTANKLKLTEQGTPSGAK